MDGDKRKIVIELTQDEIKKLGTMVDVDIQDDSDVEYCVRAIIETIGG